jgi:peptidyl-prolyl cis-trans isomerase C
MSSAEAVLQSHRKAHGEAMDSTSTVSSGNPSAGRKTPQNILGTWVARLGREPLLHFAVLGFGLWYCIEWWHVANSRYTIHVGAAQRHRIAAAYELQFGKEPTQQQFSALLDRYIRDEIYFREALTLGLDEKDEIVRRRLVQKYEFLATDLVPVDSPDTKTLEKWFEKNEKKYAIPPRVAFSHVYFSVDGRAGGRAKLRAEVVLADLARTQVVRAPTRGDAFPGPTDFAELTLDDANRVFGASELSTELFTVAPGNWFGPFRSGYGWHLIYVTRRFPAEVPSIAKIQDRVRMDYLEEQHGLMAERKLRDLRRKYTIRYDGPPK